MKRSSPNTVASGACTRARSSNGVKPVPRPMTGTVGRTSVRRKDEKQILKLEKELRHKEKALAETAALLVLSKKLEAIWGDEEK